MILELERLYQIDQQELNSHVCYHKLKDDYGEKQYDEPSSLDWQFINKVCDEDFKGMDLDQKLVCYTHVEQNVGTLPYYMHGIYCKATIFSELL